ncbi:RNA polymerase sigma factor [Pedobacter sp. MC2016-24]|uniref:RNA polymerase sigma factor n=1 Tax=Pedobacter sp. MC2016-24 TaxID=2780090 RepID=UPI00187FE78B|nr:sigma-70 family RNA polymerase sigma factor [Pedobacter sp. MC2016-24]MBE9602240.1 sigma-70 family RNA polymerase sigma factor [Pedobacter sp. MC2016-24]
MNEDWATFVSDGNEQSFYKIYTHYCHYLNFIGLKRSFPGDKVKDAISDVFFYIWEQRTKLDHINTPHNYIVTSFLRALYKTNRADNHESLDEFDVAEFGLSPSLEELHIEQQKNAGLQALLKKYMTQLAPKQRDLLYQKFYLDLSYQEIAQANNISINTVYNTTYKAVEKLKRQIGKDEILLISLAVLLGLLLFFSKLHGS